jgi:two-component system response regulator RegA
MTDSARRLVIVEDDASFARALQRSFERRDYRVWVARSREELDGLLDKASPTYAVVDLKLGTGSGLPCVERLHAYDPAMLIVVLTGFASIATAVEAIKLGACHYLAKPSNTDDIEAAFRRAGGDTAVPIGDRTSSIKTLEWEHINETRA